MVECVDKNGFRCIRHSRGRKVIVINSDIIPNNLFVLKHKDLDVGMVRINLNSGEMDHYWMQPLGKELYWKKLNFYDNTFSDDLGSLLTDSEKIDVDAEISRFSPSSSVTGERKKKWVIRDGIRYLMKINANDYGQQSVNELIASHLHERLGWKNYVPYQIETAKIDEQEISCSLSPLFTSSKL